EAAQSALSAGKYAEALAQAEASGKLRKTARAHLARAQALQKLERVDDALTAVDAAVDIQPTYAPALELRGRILWSAGRKDEARFAFEQFLSLVDDGPKAEAVRALLRDNN
ncbi:MAG TPA: tetratricopeptide repeat protein, partial [Kofleriaceae bacterium]|nr:tetratricopeptide repeat protein [Kofleriaceae bacterium]